MAHIVGTRFDFKEMDTGNLHEFSDEELLELTKTFFSDKTGPVLVFAEICKRFAASICETSEYPVELCEHGQDWNDCPDCRH